ncbi:hypothetical protein ACFLRB_03275 [Acidobacteriota bacterium]
MVTPIERASDKMHCMMTAKCVKEYGTLPNQEMHFCAEPVTWYR